MSATQGAVGEKSQPQQAAGKSSSSRWDEFGPGAQRTAVFVGVAAACLAITGLFELASRPAEIQEYGKVGAEFYPEFTDPTVAKSLSVKVIDADELKPLEFSVEQSENGRWVIPSHHNYPADAEDQLAETASSVIGIKRGAMVTRWSADHTRYGVVDPETDSVGVDEIDGIGKRLTLRGADDTVLASYVIGKKVDDSDNQYYVRHPAEDETYIAELDISLSTKFSDWVNTELLGVNNFDVRLIGLKDYSFVERGPGALAVTKTVETTLNRESSSADWQMEGIDAESQEVDKDAIGDTVNAAADLAILGVRPKQPGLTADLKLDREALRSQRDLDRLQADLMARGFLLQPNQGDQDDLRLISREGEISVGTEDGLEYQLYFGSVFTGSSEELEIGLTSDDSSQDGASSESDEKDSDSSDSSQESEAEASSEEAEDDEDSDSSGKPGRYVFVRVVVTPTLLGEKPNPVEPEMPEELKQAEEEAENKAEADEEAAEESSTEPSESDEETSADESSDDADDESGQSEPGAEGDADSTSGDAEASEEEQDPGPTEEEKKEARLQELRQQYEEAQQKYTDDQRALDEYEEKLKTANEKAEELNRRFGQWYYVIAGESYDKLSLSREDLIKAKEPEQTEGSDATAEGADSSGPTFGIQPPTGLSAPEIATPTASGDESSGDDGKDEKDADEKGAEESGADESSADAKKDSGETDPDASETTEEATADNEPDEGSSTADEGAAADSTPDEAEADPQPLDKGD